MTQETRLLITGNLGSLNLDDRWKIHFEAVDPRVGSPAKSHIQRCPLKSSKEKVCRPTWRMAFLLPTFSSISKVPSDTAQ